MSENRRIFLTKLGATLVTLPLLSGMVPVEPPESLYHEDAEIFVGLWENEIWTFRPQDYDCSVFFEVQQFGDEPKKRIVSVFFKQTPEKKVIEFSYLEPVGYKYPESEEDE